MNPTIFDQSRKGASGDQIFDPDFALPETIAPNLSLPEMTEIELVRHYTNLSRKNHGVDSGTYPLGSCTMKYNPKRNDLYADLPGFRHIHPHQPAHTTPGLWELMFNLQNNIAEITGMDHICLQPAAGAHGELTGLLMIKKYFAVKGEKRTKVLIADSAHGTNPASAAMAGFTCRIIPTTRDGLMDMDRLKKELNDDVAALMLTNPSTLGLFEENIVEIAKLVHQSGALLYYDGANLNALMGIVRPGDMGFDIIHINTHKTLSTPHGGGGPGAGPVGVKEFLKEYLPNPIITKTGPQDLAKHAIGRMKNFNGHIGVLIRAYAYIATLGADGVKQTSQNAVLNANYLQAKLRDILPPVFDKICMHECLLSGNNLKISAYSFAKRLIDYAVHPPTLVGAGCVYFGEDLKSAMLIEPTETETKQSLDQLVDIFRKVLAEAEQDQTLVETAPHSTTVSKIEMRSKEVA